MTRVGAARKLTTCRLGGFYWRSQHCLVSGSCVVVVSSCEEGAGAAPAFGQAPAVLELLERGWSIRAAVREVGVGRTTGANWTRGYKVYRRGKVVGFVPPWERLAVRQISQAPHMRTWLQGYSIIAPSHCRPSWSRPADQERQRPTQRKGWYHPRTSFIRSNLVRPRSGRHLMTHRPTRQPQR